MQVDDIRFFIDSIGEAWTVRIEVGLVAHLAHDVYIIHVSLGKEEKRQFHLRMPAGDAYAEVSALEVEAYRCRILLFLPFSGAVECLQGLRHNPPVLARREVRKLKGLPEYFSYLVYHTRISLPNFFASLLRRVCIFMISSMISFISPASFTCVSLALSSFRWDET